MKFSLNKLCCWASRQVDLEASLTGQFIFTSSSRWKNHWKKPQHMERETTICLIDLNQHCWGGEKIVFSTNNLFEGKRSHTEHRKVAFIVEHCAAPEPFWVTFSLNKLLQTANSQAKSYSILGLWDNLFLLTVETAIILSECCEPDRHSGLVPRYLRIDTLMLWGPVHFQVFRCQKTLATGPTGVFTPSSGADFSTFLLLSELLMVLKQWKMLQLSAEAKLLRGTNDLWCFA